MQLWANNAKSTLSASIADTDTGFALQTGEGALFPAPSAGEFFKVTLYEVVSGQEVNHEIVTVTARVSDTLTVVRAQEGTTARVFAADTPVQLRVTAGGMEGLLRKSGDSMSGLLQLDQSTNIVAAATTDLGTATGNAVTVTHASGTVAITSFGGASLQSGTELTITWSVSGGTLTATHNATSLILPSAANLTIADGDVWKAQKTDDAQAYWRVIDITKADGTPIYTASSVPTGTILDYGGSSPPSGFLECDGSNVSRATYSDLFTVIGVAFGVGDGSTTFGLPDFRRRVAVGSGGTGTGTLANTVGAEGGAETHTLSSTEMPSHTHTQNAHNHSQNAHSHVAERLVTGGLSGMPSGSLTRNTTSGNATATNNAATATNQSTGGGGAHNNMQPSLVVLKIIKT